MEWHPQALNQLHDVVHDVIVEHVRGKIPNGLSIRYFVMTDIGVQDMEGNISNLKIGEGSLAFDVATSDRESSDALVPTQRELELWMREAVNSNLVAALNTKLAENYEESDFVSVQQARYVSNSELAIEGLDDGEVSTQSARSSSSANTALATSVAVAGVAVLVLAALLVRSYRQRSSEVIVPYALENADAPPADSSGATHQTRSRKPTRQEPLAVEDRGRSRSSQADNSSDVRSLAESESSWTMGTEMGDSIAVQSVATHPSIGAVSTESFEHDRQVYIQKDMLTTTWSGQNATGSGSGRTESVLQPSHFTASTEQQGSRRWTDVDESPSPFVVSSHDGAEVGEEVFLMPDGTERGKPQAELL
jgi:hypothetical protein